MGTGDNLSDLRLDPRGDAFPHVGLDERENGVEAIACLTQI
jgi:hypothetical protein